ncbi:MAG: hypothetical protein NTW73_02635 [Candidatus Parcubacteria bacterium]|nr:hypothetical protein [Candidatus Parcubacteria bacterium]
MEFCGQKNIVAFLKRQLDPEKRLIQSLLFFGPEHLGKATLAYIFSQSLICEKKVWSGCGKCPSCRAYLKNFHPDVKILSNEDQEKSLIIEQARLSSEFLSYKPQLASLKILIIDGAENLTFEAQSAFLKILEEPPQQSLIILISSQIDRLLLTVRSRLLPLRFQSVANEEISVWLNKEKINPAEMEKAISYGLNKPGLIKKYLIDPSCYKKSQDARNNLDRILQSGFADKSRILEQIIKKEGSLDFNLKEWLQLGRENMLSEIFKNQNQTDTLNISLNDKIKLLKELTRAQSLLEQYNLNTRLLMENIFLA